jgi:hypothetical protein
MNRGCVLCLGSALLFTVVSNALLDSSAVSTGHNLHHSEAALVWMLSQYLTFVTVN